MTDTSIPEEASSKKYIWKNPLAVWGTATGNKEAASIQVPDPATPWIRNLAYKVKTYPVGRLKYFIIWPTHGSRTWDADTLVANPTQSSEHQGPLQPQDRDRREEDSRPPADLLAAVPHRPGPRSVDFPRKQYERTADRRRDIRGVRRNQCLLDPHPRHRLIFSLATYAVVGTAAFLTSYLSIQYGVPWYLLMPIGAFVGLAFGVLIAAPALRLDGFYYALLTLGLNELFRVFFTTSKQFGAASGGLYGADSFISQSWAPVTQSVVAYYAAFALLIASLFLFRFINGKRLGRVLRMAPEKREAFAAACGVDYKRARITIFLATSVALGFIGGFYAALYRGVAYSIFDFQTVLLGLAMVTIGGIGRAEGAVLGTLVVVFLRDVLIEFGPWRYLIIGGLMLAVVLFLNNGYFGIRKQFNAWRAKKRGEWRSTRTEKGGEALPEEATEIEDKDALYFRRYDKMQRDYLKTLICTGDHRRTPPTAARAALGGT